MIKTVEWAPGTAQGSLLTTIDIPDDLMTSMVYDKLDGFATFKADTIFRVQVNAQPFQCGRLVMAYIPMPDSLSTRTAELTRAIDRIIALPHVQLDISEQSEVTLRVPYISPYSAYNLIEGRYRWGRVVVAVYSPLNQVSQPNLKVNIFGYYDNVTLGYPTLGTIALSPVAVAREQVNLNSEADMLRIAESRNFPTKIAASINGVIQKGSDILGNVLPQSKSFTNPVAKISDAAFDIISMIPGFKKPDKTNHGETVLFRPTQYFGNVDGVEHSHKLGYHAMNRIDFQPDFAGSKMDEMSFDYVKRIPNYIASFSYSNSNVYGDALWTTAVSPCYRSADYTTINGARNFSFPTPTSLTYAIGPFSLWRGSIVYTFRAVKTEYHSGRIEFSFNPFINLDMYNTNKTTRSEYVYKVILDLRTQTEISFTVPYAGTTPFKRIRPEINPLSTAGISVNDFNVFATGVLGVRALTPLVLGSTVVPSTIQILVEMKGGPDFEVECPNSTGWMPIHSITPAATGRDTVDSELVSTAQEQANFASTGQHDIRSDYLEDKIEIKDITGISSNISLNTEKSLSCVGESFGNFRDFIKRFGWHKNQSVAFSNTKILSGIPIVNYTSSISGSGLTLTADGGSTPLTMVSSMYAFFRGGFRAKVYIHELPAGEMVQGALIDNSQDTNVPQPLALQSLQYELSDKRLYEFSWPYYCPTYLSTYPSGALNLISDLVNPTTYARISTVSAHPVAYAMAAADDFDCGFYLGAPLSWNWEIERLAGRLDSSYGFVTSPLRVDPFDKI